MNLSYFHIATYLFVFVASKLGYWLIFDKKWHIPGYYALIPFYGMWIFYKQVLGHGYYYLISFIPVAGMFINIYSKYQLSKMYHYSIGITTGLVLFPFIFLPYLGFSNTNELMSLPSKERIIYRRDLNNEES